MRETCDDEVTEFWGRLLQEAVRNIGVHLDTRQNWNVNWQLGLSLYTEAKSPAQSWDIIQMNSKDDLMSSTVGNSA